MVLKSFFTPLSSSYSSTTYRPRLPLFNCTSIWAVLVVLLGGLADGVYALRNVSFPQSSTSIAYTGEWDFRNDTQDVGGMHRTATRGNATAEFTFTGVAVYYMAPKWPYSLRTSVALDGRVGIILDLQDRDSPVQPRNSNATVASSVIERGVWTNLPSGVHTLTISVPLGDQEAVVDNFIVTELEPGDPIPSSTGSSADTSSSTSTSTSPDDTIPTPTPTDVGADTLPTITSTVTTIEDLGTLTQTVIVIEPSPLPGSSSSSSSGSSSSGTSAHTKRLAIGFGVAFGVLLVLAILGVWYWLVIRERRAERGDSIVTPLPKGVKPLPPTPFGEDNDGVGGGYEQHQQPPPPLPQEQQQQQPENQPQSQQQPPEQSLPMQELDTSGSVLGSGVAGVGVSATAAAAAREAAREARRESQRNSRRHSFDAGFGYGGGGSMRPYFMQQPEPFAEDYIPTPRVGM